MNSKGQAHIYGLPYNHKEALSYARELTKATKIPINLDVLSRRSTIEICQEIEQLENQAIKKEISQIGFSKPEMCEILNNFTNQYTNKMTGAGAGAERQMGKGGDFKGLSRNDLCSELASAEIYDQANKCFDQYKNVNQVDLIKIAEKMNLPGNNKKKSKTRLCQDITKRHMEALKIVNYLPKK